nr:immunoglobulin light chain junction region [Macaca mulatta]MOV63835.1 immunoglobulin light chain junction region [Macaca mulatta]
CQQGYMYPLTF